MSSDVLRDKRKTTKMIILLELTSRGPVRFKTLAEKLDMTVQGVSDYFKIMTKEKLIRKANGEYKATQKGINLLHDKFMEIREFVITEMNRLRIIDNCTALAGNRIRSGNRIGLFMEDGRLVAYRNRKSGSTGIAIMDAEKGEDVGINRLEGIVDLKIGRLYILQVPGTGDGGSRSLSPGKLKKILKRIQPDKTATIGATSLVVARTAGIKPDIEFAALDASIEACQRGLDVALFLEPDRVHEAISRVKEFNEGSEDKIRFTVTQLGDEAAR
jgi:putative transcriptional regulator